MSESDGVIDSLQGNFELQDDAIRGSESSAAQHRHPRASSASFAPFTTRIRFCPLGSTKIGATPLEQPSTCFTCEALMPSFLKFSIVAGPNRSAPTLATIETSAPHKSRSSGLVGPLAAKAQIEALAEDCFARIGEAIGERGEVDVCAANHCDSRLFFHRDEFGQCRTEIFETHRLPPSHPIALLSVRHPDVLHLGRMLKVPAPFCLFIDQTSRFRDHRS